MNIIRYKTSLINITMSHYSVNSLSIYVPFGALLYCSDTLHSDIMASSVTLLQSLATLHSHSICVSNCSLSSSSKCIASSIIPSYIENHVKVEEEKCEWKYECDRRRDKGNGGGRGRGGIKRGFSVKKSRQEIR